MHHTHPLSKPTQDYAAAYSWFHASGRRDYSPWFMTLLCTSRIALVYSKFTRDPTQASGFRNITLLPCGFKLSALIFVRTETNGLSTSDIEQGTILQDFNSSALSSQKGQSQSIRFRRLLPHPIQVQIKAPRLDRLYFLLPSCFSKSRGFRGSGGSGSLCMFELLKDAEVNQTPPPFIPRSARLAQFLEHQRI